MSKEKQNIKLEKVDAKTVYENLLIKYAELETENNKLLDVINNQDVKIADLEKQLNFKTRYVKGEKAIDQLAQAKEILKMIVDYYPCYNKTITEQAEQFLKATSE